MSQQISRLCYRKNWRKYTPIDSILKPKKLGKGENACFLGIKIKSRYSKRDINENEIVIQTDWSSKSLKWSYRSVTLGHRTRNVWRLRLIISLWNINFKRSFQLSSRIFLDALSEKKLESSTKESLSSETLNFLWLMSFTSKQKKFHSYSKGESYERARSREKRNENSIRIFFSSLLSMLNQSRGRGIPREDAAEKLKKKIAVERPSIEKKNESFSSSLYTCRWNLTLFDANSHATLPAEWQWF